MNLKQLHEGKKKRFLSYCLVIDQVNGSTLVSDDVSRKDLTARTGVDDEFIDTFSEEYQKYLSFTVIPRQLSKKNGYVSILIDGKKESVAVKDIKDMAVVFKYE